MFDVYGPGVATPVYKCHNQRCRELRDAIGKYFLRLEKYHDDSQQ